MNKIFHLRILGLRLAIKLFGIYLRKAAGKEITTEENAYLVYYNVLLRNGFRHVEELKGIFKIRTRENLCLFLRKYPSSDAQIIEQIWTDREYAVVVDEIFRHFKPGSLNIVDAGANVGYSSVFLFHKLRERYKLTIVAIEPSVDNIGILEMNFKEAGISNFMVEQAGLYNKSCYLEMVKDFRDGKDWSIQVREVSAKTTLTAIEISDILEKNNWAVIDFIKIDIEGAERFLFNDSTYAAGFLRKIKLLAIEIHEEYDIKDLIQGYLTENNFWFFEHGELVIAINQSYFKTYIC